MLFEIGSSLFLSAGLLLSIRNKEMPDKKKIEKIFEYTKIWVTTLNGDIKKPIFIRKEEIANNGFKYVYRLPLGLPSKVFQKLNDNVGVFKDGLNKNVEIEFDGMLHVNVYEHDLPSDWNYEEVMPSLNKGSWNIPVGQTFKGKVFRDFDKIPHSVIGGTTRYGKTVFLKSTMTSLILTNPNDIEFYIIDLKNKLEFGKYEKLKQVKQVAGTPEEALEMLNVLSTHMGSMMDYFRKNNITNIVDSPIKKRLFVIVDEANRLIPENRSDKVKMAIKRHLEDIACVMGGLGVRLIFCTQYPVSTTLPRDIKQNSDAKFSFRLQNKYASEVVLGEGNGHAADLENVRGRCISIQGADLVEMQTPNITDEQMMSLLSEYIEEDNIIEERESTSDVIQIRDIES